jgi:hypothetical protein
MNVAIDEGWPDHSFTEIKRGNFGRQVGKHLPSLSHGRDFRPSQEDKSVFDRGLGNGKDPASG